MRLKLVVQFIALERNLACILLTAALFFAPAPSFANCADQLSLPTPSERSAQAEFEKTLQLAFQNQLLFTVTGQKPFVLITDHGRLPVRDFFNRLEMFRQALRPGPADVEWFFSKGPMNPRTGRPNDWIFFYNRKSLAALIQDPEVIRNFEHAGVRFNAVQDAVDFMKKRFSDRELSGTKLSYRDDLILGTLLGYPPSDVAAYASRQDGARTVHWMIEDPDGVAYYIATYRSYLSSDSPVFAKLRDRSYAAMSWFSAQRRAGRSLLSILLHVQRL